MDRDRAELKLLLTLPGLTGEQVGALAGLSQQSISAQLCGQRRLRRDVVVAARLAALDMAIHSLSVLRRCLAETPEDDRAAGGGR